MAECKVFAFEAFIAAMQNIARDLSVHGSLRLAPHNRAKLIDGHSWP